MIVALGGRGGGAFPVGALIEAVVEIIRPGRLHGVACGAGLAGLASCATATTTTTTTTATATTALTLALRARSALLRHVGSVLRAALTLAGADRCRLREGRSGGSACAGRQRTVRRSGCADDAGGSGHARRIRSLGTVAIAAVTVTTVTVTVASAAALAITAAATAPFGGRLLGSRRRLLGGDTRLARAVALATLVLVVLIPSALAAVTVAITAATALAVAVTPPTTVPVPVATTAAVTIAPITLAASARRRLGRDGQLHLRLRIAEQPAPQAHEHAGARA